MSASWVDLFPWLARWSGTDSDHDPGWIHAPVAPLPSAEMERRVDLIVDLILGPLDGWTIGRLIPSLPLGRSLGELSRSLSARLSNVLKREDLRSTSDLIDLEVRDFYAIRNVGAGTARELLGALVVTSIQEGSEPSASTGTSMPGADDDRPLPSESLLLSIPPFGVPDLDPSSLDDYLVDLSKVARWDLISGRGDGCVHANREERSTPMEVAEASTRVAALTANMLFPEGTIESVPVILTSWVGGCTEVDQAILRDRMFADQPRTLDSLGLEFGVTRERIRQREGAVVARLEAWISSSESMRWLMQAVRMRVGALLPLGELVGDFPVLDDPVAILEQPVWRVMDRLDPAYEIEDGWCAVPTVSQGRKETAESMQDIASDNGVVALAETAGFGVLAGVGEVPKWFPDWLRACGFRLYQGYVVTRAGSLQDRAAAALEIGGEPSRLIEMPAFVAEGRSERSLANALAADPRFVRVDKQRWALAEWGVGEYTGIADAIRRELDQAGGSLPLGKLVAALTARYDVAESSVRAYASGNPFIVVDGIVRMATSTRTPRVRKTWQQTRRLYKRDNTWLYRITVNRDHMRGSGSPCPVALAVVLGVPSAGERHFTGPMGTLGVHWPSLQPTMGSIGGFLRCIDAGIGDDVLVCFDEGTVHAEVATLSSDHPWVIAAQLAGAPQDLDAKRAHAYLAVAVGSSPGVGTSDLIATLEARGDNDLAQLILDGVHTSGARTPMNGPLSTQGETDIDDILDLL